MLNYIVISYTDDAYYLYYSLLVDIFYILYVLYVYELFTHIVLHQYLPPL